MSDSQNRFQAGSIWVFQSPLNALDEDIARYPWLQEPYRHYRILNELSRGGYAIAFVAAACDAVGQDLSAERFVMKFPHLDTSGRFSERDKANRLYLSDKKTLDEWRFTRHRLRKSLCATHIIDIDSQWLGSLAWVVTVQPFLAGHVPLLSWMATHDLIPSEELKQRQWQGLYHGTDWKRLCLA